MYRWGDGRQLYGCAGAPARASHARGQSMTEKPVDVFRRHLETGELVIQKCATCGALGMYPRHACPACQSEELGWQRASGRGGLHSFTVLRLGAPQGFEVDLPYALGVVNL